MRARTAGLTVLLLVGAACASDGASAPEPSATLTASPASPSPTPPGRVSVPAPSPVSTPVSGWSRVPQAPIPPRTDHGAAWTGSEMLVVGGTARIGGGLGDLDDAAAFSPSEGKWRELSRLPVDGRAEPVTVWTGTELLVWGGVAYEPDAAPEPLNDGARYDPGADRWRTMAPFPLAPRREPMTVWTGSELVVWGGWRDGRTFFDDGARYDPETDTWQVMADAPLSGRSRAAAVWTGREVLVWGGANGGGGDAEGESEGEGPRTTALTDGAAYDPTGDRWRRTADGPDHHPDAEPSAVWTGEELLVWLGGSGEEASAGRYDPEQVVWRAVPGPPLSGHRVDQSEVWTGDRLVVWGGRAAEGGKQLWNDGGAYDPGGNAWTSLAQAPLNPRAGHSAVWTGEAMILWGGREQPPDLEPGSTQDSNDGASWRP